MSAVISKRASAPRLPLWAAGVGIGLLWLVYTALQLPLEFGWSRAALAGLELALATLAVGLLLAAGFDRRMCFLQVRPLSVKGAVALALTLPLLLPVFLTGHFSGWQAGNVLVYGTLEALTQVLFFRCALLPLLLRVLSGKPLAAIGLAALLHGLWHIGPVGLGLPWTSALPVMLVPFLAGLAWNWQIWRDRTAVWVAVYHLLIDQGMAMFAW